MSIENNKDNNSSNKNKRWLYTILNLDKRIVYICIFLAIALPFFLNPVVDIKSTKWVKSSYDLVEEAAQKRKPILIGFDYDPATLAELQPMAMAIIRHAFSKNVKVVGINFLLNGTSLAADTLEKVAKEYDKKYGEDYVFFGFLPQISVVLLNFGEDFRKSYKKDYYGKDLNEIPMLKGLQNFDDFHAVFCLSGTGLPSTYIVYGVDRFKFNYIAGVTAVSAADYYPYLQSGQMKGLLGGMKAAAEYEGLLGKISDGMRGMASQSWGHITIIAFIIIGNILFYVKKRYEDEDKEKKL
ncbi:MAG: hypothetical protein HQK51_18465 [Oligoflexia bacterium]|nr:hypothetical protein [Oligoflexia bacterium]